MAMTLPRILTIAGSDSGGGAGIQADITTITHLGGYAMSAITAITAQNTLGVRSVFPVPCEGVHDQIAAVLDDIGADAIKTGMLYSAEIIRTIAAVLPPNIPLILDPVMIAKGGASLLQREAIDAFITLLLPKATLVTPNIPEAEALTGQGGIRSVAEMEQAGRMLRKKGARASLIKGGHLPEIGEEVVDVLVLPNKIRIFKHQFVKTRNTHGTGCTLASAIAYYIGAGSSLEDACEKATDYVHRAILNAPQGIGEGCGPLGRG
jgi:hydroxymethylpyrimidine/phosphomethylpyrimidine kinase